MSSNKGKGKLVAGKGYDNDKTGGDRKRKNRDVLKFFEDTAAEDSDDFSDFDYDFSYDYGTESKGKSEAGKSQQLPFLPKEEELSGDELERILEERYRNGSQYVRYADDDYEMKRSEDGSFVLPYLPDPPIWKVKCKVGREKHTVFCLMQKYVDLKLLGTKLQIISAFAVEHIKGFVFVEAAKQSDASEACRQLADVYYSLVARVPKNEVSHLLAVRRKQSEVLEGMWARVKNGIYKGDLAQVVAVNNARKKATVKLIPRIDLQALAGKFGGAASAKKVAVPAPRLISSTDLEEFRPLVQYKRDRDTGKHFEVLDGLMLKDGYLYKKLSIDSLSFWDVNPSEEELQKFSFSSKGGSDNLEWLSQLYGEQKKKCSLNIEKGGGKGEGSSGSSALDGFEVHDLVVFGKKEFGMIVGMEKDENYKILKDGSDGPTVVTLGKKDLKIVQSDKKFTALDHRMKTISINDTIKILDGVSKGKQGTVKQIYRGIVFLTDQNEAENDTYFCAKSQMSQKIKRCDDVCQGKGDETGPSDFGDIPSSPRSPLSPNNPSQTKESNHDFNQKDKEGMFAVGQSLRIRVGPLKGYLCSVLAIRYSDVTVKLASQQKVLTVKPEHLSEIRGKSFGSSMSDDPGSGSIKPFDLLGSEGCSNDWMQGAGGAGETNGWNTGSVSSERGSWPAFPSSGSTLDDSNANICGPAGDVSGKDAEETAWETKVGNEQNSAWGEAVVKRAATSSEQIGELGTTECGWGKTSGGAASGKAEGGWGKTSGGAASAQTEAGWGQQKTWVTDNNVAHASSGWCRSMDSEDKSAGKNVNDAWGKFNTSQDKDPSKDFCSNEWGRNNSSGSKEWNNINPAPDTRTGGWGESGGGLAQKQEKSTIRGWEGGNIEDNKSGKWGNSDKGEGTSGWKKSGDSSLWDQPKTFEDDVGFNRGRGSGGRKVRGGYCEGRDQSGRGRGGSFGREQSSSWNKEGQDGSYSQNSFGRNSGQDCAWGKDKGWNSDGGGGNGSWKNLNKSVEHNNSSGTKGWGAGRDTGGASHLSGVQGSVESASWIDGSVTSERGTGTAAWNSGSSTWSQQKSLENVKGLSTESASWDKVMESHEKGSDTDVNNCWAKGKDLQEKSTSDPEDPWGKAAQWGSKNSSSGTKGWKSSTAALESQVGGWGQAAGKWGQAQEENSAGESSKGKSAVQECARAWKKDGESSQGQMESWRKPSWSKSAESDTWNPSIENDQGFDGTCDRDSGGRRGRGGYRGGRDGRGRGGRSFGRGQFSSENKESHDGLSWGSSFEGNNDQGKSWGNDNYRNDGKRSSSGNDGQFNGWGKNKGGVGGWGSSSSGNNDQGSGQGKLKGWDNDVEREEQGSKKQKTSFEGNVSSGNKEWGGFPGRENRASGVQGQTESGKWNSEGAASERGLGISSWPTGNDSREKANGGGSEDSWGKSAQWGNKSSLSGSKEWKSSTTTAPPDSQIGGWRKDGDWSKHSSTGNDEGYEGGRGYGGRRGRGGFRGGRDGRGRGGRSFGRGQFSSWNKESQDASSWGNSAAAGGSGDQGGSGWGKDKGWHNEGSSGCSFGENSDQGGSRGNAWNSGGGGGGWGSSSAERTDQTGGWAKGWSSKGGSSVGKTDQGGGSGKGLGGDGGGWDGNLSGGNNYHGGNSSGGWGKAGGSPGIPSSPGGSGGQGDGSGKISSGGWGGNSSGGNNDQGGNSSGGWGKAGGSSGIPSAAGSSGGQGGGWGGNLSVGNNDQGGNSSGGWGKGWGKDGRTSENLSGSGGSGGWGGKSSCGNNDHRGNLSGGWGKAGGSSGIPSGDGSSGGQGGGWGGSSSVGNNDQGGNSSGGWGKGWGKDGGTSGNPSGAGGSGGSGKGLSVDGGGWGGYLSGGSKNQGGKSSGGWGKGTDSDKDGGSSGNPSDASGGGGSGKRSSSGWGE
ncbi:hypothetical protein Nepgr_015140 [Nepenthes gracilis]|uniref:Protein RNA-directed DNA methylation 3 n=1 Tax=Nepenthes gracilis TaxID=150966 RepID=A0AAD3SM27_NEPGR|nr:hypothetical protein Nepgr_015140 [Nepenthes gracilis]